MIDVDLYVFKNVKSILINILFSTLQSYVFLEIFTNNILCYVVFGL